MYVLDRIREAAGRPATTRAIAREANAIAAGNTELLEQRVAELELALDDEGWRRLGHDLERDFSHDGRVRVMALSRLMFLKNPLIRRAVNVQTYYVMGQGVEIVARDEEVNDVLQRHLDDHANRRVLYGSQARADKERDLQLEGNLFFALFTNSATGRVQVRTLPPEEIVDVYCNPEDRDEPWYYARAYRRGATPGATATPGELVKVCYIDWRYLRVLEAKGEAVPGQVGDELVEMMDEGGQPVPVFHVKVGGTSRMKFGHPDVYAALDWARAYKDFLTDWASISRSLARFAWKFSTKGKKVAAVKERFGSRLSTDAPESNPAPTTGSMAILPEANDLTPMRTAGAQAGADDGLQLRKMVAAGTDIPDTILGADPDMGNLATARTLDRPTELAMRDRQTLWADVLRGLMEAVVVAAIEAGELEGAVTNEDGNLIIDLGNDSTTGDPRDPTVDVTFPPILEQSAEDRVKAIVGAATLDGKPNAHTLPDRVLARLLLTALGTEDVDELIELLFPDGDPEAMPDTDPRNTPEPTAPPAGDTPAEPAPDTVPAAEAEWRAAALEVRRQLAELTE